MAAAAGAGHHYPDPLADALRAELARLHDVDPDQILVGNGSDELIFLLAWAYLAHGGHAVCADPAYRMDEISSMVVDARLTRVPLRRWTHDLDAMAVLAGKGDRASPLVLRLPSRGFPRRDRAIRVTMEMS